MDSQRSDTGNRGYSKDHRHCIRISQQVLRSYQQARCAPYSRGKELYFTLLRPKHPNPMDEDDKPWVWTLVLAQSASSQTIRAVETAASYAAKPSAIKLQPQLSQDGPLKTACSTHQRQRQRQGERKSKSPSGSRDHDGGQNKKKKRTGGWWDYQEDW